MNPESIALKHTEAASSSVSTVSELYTCLALLACAHSGYTNMNKDINSLLSGV